jgi:hypothetical protein
MTPMCITMQRFRATGYPTWNQKLRLSRLDEFWYGGHILVVVNKNSQFNTRAPKIPKFHQQLSDIIMHTFGIQS